MLGWLVAAEALQSAGAEFFIYLTTLSYILLTLGFLWRAAISIVYTASYYGSKEKLARFFPTSASDVRAYNQDNMRWYLKISWFMHTTSSVLAVGVALLYWALLCAVQKWSSSQSTSYNTTNLTQSMSCQPTAMNMHFHGVNAIIALFDILMSSVPFPLCHIFYTSILTFFYVIFSLIYWGAYHRSNIGVIYPILDYGNYSGFVAVALIIVPMALYLVLLFIVKLRDRALQKFFSRQVIRESAMDDGYVVLN